MTYKIIGTIITTALGFGLVHCAGGITVAEAVTSVLDIASKF